MFLEASATGVAVVAGRSGGAPETVLDGETGRVVDGRSLDEIAGVITELLSDTRRARRMGEAGRRWIEPGLELGQPHRAAGQRCARVV